MYHYYTYDGRTLCSAGALPYPEISALPETGEVLWVFHRPPLAGRDTFPVTDPAQLTEEEGVASLCTAPCPEDVPPALLSAIRAGRVRAVNGSHPRLEELLAPVSRPEKVRVNLLALGDVGSTLLLGLRLMGGDVISSIGICDLREGVARRWEFELNQIQLPGPYDALPPVEIVPPERLFDGDVFLFCASRFVPDTAVKTGDVRMAQYQLNRELAEVKRHREITRAQRSRSHMPVAAIVGYTNAGKSTLLNRLTGAGVLEENKLFATLDPTTRTLTLDNGTKILLTDTVGFIRKLPHHLVEAFKSTLEEAKYADVILHVVDASNEQMETQMYVVYDTLRRLEVGDKPILTLFNKTDREGIRTDLRDLKADQTLKISAKTGAGLSELTDALEEVLRRDKIYVERLYPFDQAGIIQLIRKEGELVSEEYTAEGIEVRA